MSPRFSSNLLFPLLFLSLFSLFFFPLTAAEITVPRMDIFTHGFLDGGDLILRSQGDINLAVKGGVKLAGEVGFRFRADNLEQYFMDEDVEDPAAMEFRNAQVTVRELGNIPLNLTYFVGESDILCDGSSFTSIFGTRDFSTDYSGYLYFYNETLYEGITRISGTGLSLSYMLPSGDTQFHLYTYQDNYLEAGKYSSVGRFLLNKENIKLEAFVQGSYPKGSFGYYAGGLMFYFRPAPIGEFFTQIGIPRWDGGSFSTKLFYFLFEPRIRLNILTINMTFLLRPAYYLNEETNEEGNMDFNVNFHLGKPESFPISGGLESTMKINSETTDGDGKKFFNYALSPYFEALTSGVIWNIKFKYNILKNDNVPRFEGFIGVKAVL